MRDPTHSDRYLAGVRGGFPMAPVAVGEGPEGVADAVRSLVKAKKRPHRSMEFELQGLRNNGLARFATGSHPDRA